MRVLRASRTFLAMAGLASWSPPIPLVIIRTKERKKEERKRRKAYLWVCLVREENRKGDGVSDIAKGTCCCHHSSRLRFLSANVVTIKMNHNEEMHKRKDMVGKRGGTAESTALNDCLMGPAKAGWGPTSTTACTPSTSLIACWMALQKCTFNNE